MKKETKPFQRTVGEKEIIAFRPGSPETFTGIAIVDAVLDAFYKFYPIEPVEVAAYLELPEKPLSHTMQILTGLRLSDIAQLVRIFYVRVAIFNNLDAPIDEIAAKAKLSGRSSLHHLMNNKKFAHYFVDIDLQALRPQRYYVSKKGEKKSPRYY